MTQPAPPAVADSSLERSGPDHRGPERIHGQTLDQSTRHQLKRVPHTLLSNTGGLWVPGLPTSRRHPFHPSPQRVYRGKDKANVSPQKTTQDQVVPVWLFVSKSELPLQILRQP